ncbi:hypothetical protein [Vibrio sp. SCSIO 43136]|nr:hypothetical protein [Vibrio sp. SCSIO 43136]USD66856.1 hypothetical protein J4N39_19585 [Vibrio sp. SCSIO 43136]
MQWQPAARDFGEWLAQSLHWQRSLWWHHIVGSSTGSRSACRGPDHQ